MQTAIEILFGLIMIVVLVPALIGAIIQGCFGREQPGKEENDDD